MVQRGYIVYSVQQGTVVQCVVEEWYGVWEGYMCESVSCQSVKTEDCSCFILLSFDLFLYVCLCVKLSLALATLPPARMRPNAYLSPALRRPGDAARGGERYSGTPCVAGGVPDHDAGAR